MAEKYHLRRKNSGSGSPEAPVIYLLRFATDSNLVALTFNSALSTP
jgi:hypothetical protein